jgi:hypothetical protein
LVAALGVSALAGCSGTNASPPKLPHIAEVGTRAHEFRSVDDLAGEAVAVVVAKPTGKQFTRPLPAWDGPVGATPTPYVQMRVSKVLSGTIKPGLIDVVSPGIDENTGKEALADGGPYLMYLTLAVYAANDPAGGYAIVGGPAGVYGAAGNTDQYARIDTESPALPPTITIGTSHLPAARKTDKQVLTHGS